MNSVYVFFTFVWTPEVQAEGLGGKTDRFYRSFFRDGAANTEVLEWLSLETLQVSFIWEIRVLMMSGGRSRNISDVHTNNYLTANCFRHSDGSKLFRSDFDSVRRRHTGLASYRRLSFGVYADYGRYLQCGCHAHFYEGTHIAAHPILAVRSFQTFDVYSSPTACIGSFANGWQPSENCRKLAAGAYEAVEFGWRHRYCWE
jgi:hypothetical protein